MPETLFLRLIIAAYGNIIGGLFPIGDQTVLMIWYLKAEAARSITYEIC